MVENFVSIDQGKDSGENPRTKTGIRMGSRTRYKPDMRPNLQKAALPGVAFFLCPVRECHGEAVEEVAGQKFIGWLRFL